MVADDQFTKVYFDEEKASQEQKYVQQYVFTKPLGLFEH